MKKYFRTAAVLFLAVILTGAPDHVQETAETAHTGVDSEVEKIYGTVLGDSIARGYSTEKNVRIECYGSIVIKRKAEDEGCLYEIRNYARDGLNTEQLSKEVLARGEVLRDLAKSDIILISTGSNDLLEQCRTVIGRSLGREEELTDIEQAAKELKAQIEENPVLVFQIAEALAGWDCRAFEEEWTGMMDTVTGAKKDGAEIVVNNIYNPAENMELPDPVKRAAAGMIRDMNDIIDSYAREYGYTAADLEGSDVSEHVQSDGVHPDQTGQERIAEIVYSCL